MQINELWEELLQGQIYSCKPFDRDFIWIPIEAFKKHESLFVREVNILQAGTSFRSTHSWKHIHAIVKDEIVHCHIDTGNHKFFILFAPVHLICDVIPYIYYWIITKQHFDDIFSLETYYKHKI